MRGPNDKKRRKVQKAVVPRQATLQELKTLVNAIWGGLGLSLESFCLGAELNVWESSTMLELDEETVRVDSKDRLSASSEEGCSWASALIAARSAEMPRLLVLNTDEASQMRAVGSFLKSCDVVVLTLGDVFHRYWNDLIGGTKDSGLYTGMILSSVYLNLGAGPWSSASWWKEMEYTAGLAASSCSPDDEILKWLWPSICSDALATDSSPELPLKSGSVGRQEFLDRLKASRAVNLLGTKVSSSR
eukprot:1827201-Amphidinium_carterae.1